MSEQSLIQSSFKLKGRLCTLTVMQLLHTNLDKFESQLKDTIAQAPKLFENMPVVLDCSVIKEDGFVLKQWCQCLKAHGVIPVAIQGAHAWLNTLAQCEGLAVFSTSLSQVASPVVQETDISVEESISSAEKKETVSNLSNIANAGSAYPTKIHESPVRSGQQIVAKEGDLVVLSAVSPGAELLAAGNIYIYGSLRGRALAGMKGNNKARIFCQSLNAELISIAGVYRLSESMEVASRPSQIYLQDGRIVIEAIQSCLNS